MSREAFRGFRLSKEEIIDSDVSRFLLGIAREANERGGLGTVQGKIFFEIDGYNDDKRGLWEIPEVRRYFRKLDETAPFFLYYIANETFAPLVRTYLKMFIDQSFFTNLNPNQKIKQDAETFIRDKIQSVTSYCHKINSVEEIKVDRRETIFQIYKCMEFDVSREGVFQDYRV